ncbi:MAG TPA: GNAT family N-acetyltransferase [Pyrinomonadaceae bacterium]|nr:GNAT family N-acetyltransferase [Pyrinomonadaceae bacterium]
MVKGVQIRALNAEDWPAVRSIYQDGIATGEATFETATPSWFDWDKGHLSAARLVATSEGKVIAWAALSPVSSRTVYSGVTETTVYVAGDWRSKGIGKVLLEALIAESESHNIWTLQASIFPENEASLKIHQQCGFRVVGRRERIAQLDGIWRDTVLLERRSCL